VIHNHLAMQLAMRARLMTLVVSTTGSATLAATLTGYARSTGSFVTDGLAPGMELTPSGFSSNPVGTISDMTALAVSVSGTRSAQAAAAGRSLVVGLPSLRAWENETVEPIQGQPYVEEQYVPGPAQVQEVGSGARSEARPMYSPRIYVKSNTAIAADGRYADAILALFPPGLVLTAADGSLLCVMSSPAPYRGQRLPGVAVGWSCIPINVPFYTLN
jgi:hypothetical protein